MFLYWTLWSSVNSFVTKWDDGFMEIDLRKSNFASIRRRFHSLSYWTKTLLCCLLFPMNLDALHLAFVRLPVNAPHQIDTRFLPVTYLLYSAISSWGIHVIFLSSPCKKYYYTFMFVHVFYLCCDVIFTCAQY